MDHEEYVSGCEVVFGSIDSVSGSPFPLCLGFLAARVPRGASDFRWTRRGAPMRCESVLAEPLKQASWLACVRV